MPDATRVAEDFFAAWTSRDFDRARSLLHDDLSFRGPIDAFTDADSYIKAIQQLSQIVTGAAAQNLRRRRRRLRHLRPQYGARSEFPDRRVDRLRDGKIASIRVFFDARPFAKLAEHGQ